MAVKLEVEIYQDNSVFIAKTKIDHLPENDIIGKGSLPEDALEDWVNQIREQEVFRPD